MNLPDTIKDFVFQVYKDHFSKDFLFHNFSYTTRALESLELLLKEHSVFDEETVVYLKAACWFHATGFYKDFETGGETSIGIAKDFLKEQGWPSKSVDVVTNYIKATSANAGPKSEEEKIIHDAARFYYADTNFKEVQKLWKEELSLTRNIEYSNEEWFALLSGIFRDFFFYTPVAGKLWEVAINSNYLYVQKQHTKGDKRSKKEQIEVDKQTERGKDTVFRIVIKNHMTLSENADRKAHILLSVNSIIISLLLSRLFPKLDSPSNAYLYTPTIVFIVFTVVSIILSVIATRPRVTSGRFSKEALMNRKVNILFFGNFYRMNLKDYEDAMDIVLSDGERIYNSLIKDLYYLGKVVAKKYLILQWAYGVFMLGIILSSILYIVYFNKYN